MRDTKKEVLSFWFEEAKPVQWFQDDPSFDADISERFMVTYDMAKRDLCASWIKDADGVLALCLVLDQFPRRMFKKSPKAFESDEKILLIAKDALRKGLDQILPSVKRHFIYMPFMHSENIDEQKRSVRLFSLIKDEDPLGYDQALKRQKVIEKFGRFPHRNEILGRKSTEDEINYMALSGAGF